MMQIAAECVGRVSCSSLLWLGVSAQPILEQELAMMKNVLIVLGLLGLLSGCAATASAWIPFWYGDAEEWNEMLDEIEEYDLPGDREVGAPSG